MEDSFSKCKQILEKYSQEHLLSFYEELDDSKKEILINQILQIDFEQMENLYQDSFIDEFNPNDIVSPLPHIDKTKLSEQERDYYNHLGIESIKKGEVAVITLAGGQRYKASVIQVLKVLLN